VTSQPKDSRLPPGNPKLLVDVNVHAETTIIWDTYSALENINEARLSTGCTPQDLNNLLATCSSLKGLLWSFFAKSQLLFIKPERRGSSTQNISKGDKRALSLALLIFIL
jgi:hypothetical protein